MMEGVTKLNNNEMGDGMQCTHHPHRTNPSGICAFCLQEKLGKLVSSSFPLPPPPLSSSSSSSSYSHSPSPSSLPPHPIPSSSLQTNHHHHRLPNNKPNTCTSSTNIIFKRSKSTATPNHDIIFSPRKRNGFWSFLYPSSKHSLSKSTHKSSSSATSKKTDHVIITTEDQNNKCVTPSSSLVSRSRSVGCGSRSFSGDFFERISSGLGDCTLRRVESQREGKPNLPASASVSIKRCMKERVRCGGIFGGFVMTSSSSSSSCSWVSSSVEERKSWGWTFASPMRAFGTKTSSKRNHSSHQNATPNLSAIPSLLAVRV